MRRAFADSTDSDASYTASETRATELETKQDTLQAKLQAKESELQANLAALKQTEAKRVQPTKAALTKAAEAAVVGTN
jgi:chromosome segregation ATPase